MPNADGPPVVDIGVIGGSGLYRFLTDATPVEVATPYGAPSDTIVIGEVTGRRVAFLPRHGADHRFPPHRVPYRANLWALRSLGVRQVLAPCAVGSLRADLPAGSLVVPDQVVDRTVGRKSTYYDEGAVHVGFADPYCPNGRQAVLDAAAAHGWAAVEPATMVVIPGPRFSSRAESTAYAASGWSLVNMTGQPEATLARELALCYTAVALVTDLDAGIGTDDAVTQEDVFRVFAANLDRLRKVLLTALGRLPTARSCACARALDGLATGLELP